MKQTSLASRALATVLGAVIATAPAVGWSGQALADEEMLPEPVTQAQQPTQVQPQSQPQAGGSPAGNVSPQADDEETYTVTTSVSPEGAGTADASETTNVKKDVTVELTADSHLGYKFTNWTVTGGASLEDSKSPATSFKMPAANVTATANFEHVGIAKITFDGNGGTTEKNEKTVTQEVTKKTSVEITPTSFKRTGYKLVGWSLSKDSNASNLLKNEVVSLLESYTEKDLTLYAQWAHTHTIKVTDDGNGTATADPTEQAKGEKVTLTGTPKDGYVFDSWKVVKGGVTIENDTVASSEFIMGDEDVEIQATFTQLKTSSATATTTTTTTTSATTSTTPKTTDPEMSNSWGASFRSRDSEVTFTITQKVPKDATYMLISTDLDPALTYTVGEDDVAVAVGGQEMTSGYKVSIDGQRLTVLVDDESVAESLRDKTVTVKYSARVADGVDLNPYTTNGIASIPYSCSTTFKGVTERTVTSKTEVIKVRTSDSTQSGSSSSRTTSTGTTTRTLAATSDHTSLAGAAAALLTGAGFMVAGRRSKRR